MYQSFYKLNADPFCLTPDPRFCFHHRSYIKAKAYLSYALQRAEGFVMVTGLPGTGKSMLIKEVISELNPARFCTANLNSTQVNANDLLRLVANAFGVANKGLSKGTLLHILSDFFTQQHQTGMQILLFVDEAQDLAIDALEELRLLTNLEVNSQPAIQILLIGQQQLGELVRLPVMDQLRQRIIAACQMQAMDLTETADYIYFRLRAAGWKQDPLICSSVIHEIHRYSSGIPRLINQLCSRLFLYGFVNSKHEFEQSDISAVINELDSENLSPIKLTSNLIETEKSPPHLIHLLTEKTAV